MTDKLKVKDILENLEKYTDNSNQDVSFVDSFVGINVRDESIPTPFGRPSKTIQKWQKRTFSKELFEL